MTEPWLETMRKEAGQSQKALSEQLGIAQATLSNIENGKRRPSVDVSKKIGAALGFDWTRFYEDGDGEVS